MDPIPLTVSLHEELDRGCWPVTLGVPLAEGALQLAALGQVHVRAVRAGEVKLSAAQAVPLAQWAPGADPSVRWLLVDFQVDAAFHGPGTEYTLRSGAAPGPCSPLELTEDAPTAGQVTIDVGLGTRFVVDAAGAFGIAEVQHGKVPFVQSDRPQRFTLERGDGETYVATCTDYRVEDRGPLRIGLRFEGHFAKGDRRFGRFVVRLHFHARSRLVRLLHTFVYDGDVREKSDRVRRLSLEVPLSQPVHEVAFGTDADDPAEEHALAEDAYLLQDREGRFAPFLRLVRDPAGAAQEDPLKTTRSAGWIDARVGGGGVAVGLRRAWQSYPNELELRENAVHAHLWPRHGRVLDYRPEAAVEFYGLDEVTADNETFAEDVQAILDAPNIATGTARTHELWLQFRRGNPAQGAHDFALHCHRPALAAVESAYGCATGVLGPLHPRDEDTYPEVEAALEAMANRYRHWRERTGGYGWFDDGDVHDEVRSRGLTAVDGGWMPRPYRYWGSTHYGYPLVPWILYFRSGDRAHLEDAEATSRHVMDVDRCHVTDVAVGALAGTHHEGNTSLVHWSGQAVGANYAQLEHLLTFYYLRGERRALEVLLDYANGIVDHVGTSGVLAPVESDDPFGTGAGVENGAFAFRHARHLGAPIGNFAELARAALVPDGVYKPANLRPPGDYAGIAKAFLVALRDQAWPAASQTEREQYSQNLRWVWDGLSSVARLAPEDPATAALVRAFAELQAHEGAAFSFTAFATAWFHAPPPSTPSAPTREDLLAVGAAEVDELVARVCVSPEGAVGPAVQVADGGEVEARYGVSARSLVASEGDGGTPAAIRYPYRMRSLPVLLAALQEAASAGADVRLGRSCSVSGPRISRLRLRADGGGAPRLLVRLGWWQALRLVGPDGSERVYGEQHAFPPPPLPEWGHHHPDLVPGAFTPTAGLVLLTEAELSQSGEYRVEFPLQPTRYPRGEYIERGRADLLRVAHLHLEIDPIEPREGDELLGGPWPGRICAFGPRFYFRVPGADGQVVIRTRVPAPWGGFGFSPAIDVHRNADSSEPEQIARLRGHEPEADHELERVPATGGAGEEGPAAGGGSGDLIIAGGKVKDPFTHELVIRVEASDGEVWSLGPFPRVESPFPNIHNSSAFRPADVHDPRWFRVQLQDGSFAPVSPFARALFPSEG